MMSRLLTLNMEVVTCYVSSIMKKKPTTLFLLLFRDEDSSLPLSAAGEWADLCLWWDVPRADGPPCTDIRQPLRPADR